MKRNLTVAALLVGLVLFAVAFLHFLDPKDILRRVLVEISKLDPWTPFLFILAYIVACLIFFPGIILALGAGALFGIFKGTALVVIGATLGACAAFLISRYVARDYINARLAGHPKLEALDNATATAGWKIIALIRISPAIPFIPINFLFGLTKVPLHHFGLATMIGIIPLSFLWVYLGALAGDLAKIGTSASTQSSGAKWAMTIFGLVSTVAVTIYVTRFAKRALNETKKKPRS